MVECAPPYQHQLPLSAQGSSPIYLPQTAQNTLDLSPSLEQLLQERKPVRLLGVTLSHLVVEAEVSKYEQMSMQTLWDLAGE